MRTHVLLCHLHRRNRNLLVVINEARAKCGSGAAAKPRYKRVPARVVNGPTFLAGLARCRCRHAALIQNTGKCGRYQYYCCSKKLKEGLIACRGLRIPMGKLDTIVVDEVTKRVLQPTA